MRRAPTRARRGRRRHTPCRSGAPAHEDGAYWLLAAQNLFDTCFRVGLISCFFAEESSVSPPCSLDVGTKEIGPLLPGRVLFHGCGLVHSIL